MRARTPALPVFGLTILKRVPAQGRADWTVCATLVHYWPMKAIQVSQVGGPEVLTLADAPIPELKPNEALVQIKAAGVNFIDVYFREGRYPAPLPFINGQE